jgi:hypothetical protein
MSRSRSLTNHLLMLPSILLIGLFVSSLLAPTAEAAFKGCRSDPVVILSDGTILDIQAEIGTNVENVREIHYTVHGPRGVRLVASIRTPLIGFKGKETFSYYDDAGPGEYVTETLVRTVNNPVAVTSHTTFAKATLLFDTSVTLMYKPVNGFNDQILRYVIRR